MYCTNIRKLTFINDNFFNSYENHHPTRFGIDINVGTLEINNTTITTEYPASLYIKADKTIINDSEIIVNELYLDSKSIECSSSSTMTSEKGVIIDNENCDFSGNIQSPTIVYNGVELTTKENVSIDNAEIELKQARRNLIETFQNLSNKCRILNDDKIEGIKEKLDSQSIKRVLKKDNYKF